MMCSSPSSAASGLQQRTKQDGRAFQIPGTSGGKAKVRKGLAALTKKRKREIARQGAAARCARAALLPHPDPGSQRRRPPPVAATASGMGRKLSEASKPIIATGSMVKPSRIHADPVSGPDGKSALPRFATVLLAGDR